MERGRCSITFSERSLSAILWTPPPAYRSPRPQNQTGFPSRKNAIRRFPHSCQRSRSCPRMSPSTLHGNWKREDSLHPGSIDSSGNGSSDATAITKRRPPTCATGSTVSEFSMPRLRKCLPESSIRARSTGSPSEEIQRGHENSLEEGKAVTISRPEEIGASGSRRSGTALPAAKNHRSHDPSRGPGRSSTVPGVVLPRACRRLGISRDGAAAPCSGPSLEAASVISGFIAPTTLAQSRRLGDFLMKLRRKSP